MMVLDRTALVIAGLMCAASIGAVLARPSVKATEIGSVVALENLVPRRFGTWREDPQRYVQVVNPQTQQLLDKLYSDVLNRVYLNDQGYRIMLSVVYGSDQRGALQAHKPEVCYPAQGFIVQKNEAAVLATQFGVIPVRRLKTAMRARHEPVTYWFTIGERAVQGKLEKRLAELSLAFSGRIPDGMLFRVSSIDPDDVGAFRLHDDFIEQLLQAVSPAERKRLSGLGEV